MPELYDSILPVFRRLPPAVALQCQKRFDYLQSVRPLTGKKLGWRYMGLLMAYGNNRLTSEWGKHIKAFRGLKKRWGATRVQGQRYCSSCGNLMRMKGYSEAV